eukprot:SAG31_NODE_27028_length_432_cov_0.930931_1_plen_87_part_10
MMCTVLSVLSVLFLAACTAALSPSRAAADDSDDEAIISTRPSRVLRPRSDWDSAPLLALGGSVPSIHRRGRLSVHDTDQECPQCLMS